MNRPEVAAVERCRALGAHEEELVNCQSPATLPGRECAARLIVRQCARDSVTVDREDAAALTHPCAADRADVLENGEPARQVLPLGRSTCRRGVRTRRAIRPRAGQVLG